MLNSSQISIIPFQQLDGLVGQSDGHGIFIDCSSYSMNVGAIIPYPDGTYLLNVMILDEMQVSAYKPCSFSETFDNFELAADAARRFLASQRTEAP